MEIYEKDKIKLRLEPTKKEICMMCHWSSSCENCCNKCESKCNSEQICMLGNYDQYDRLEAWLSIQQELGYKI